MLRRLKPWRFASDALSRSVRTPLLFFHLRLAGQLCREFVESVIGRLKRTFSILRIFPGFRMLWLPMSYVRRGSEGAEP